MEYSQEIAKAIVEIQAVGFSPEKPIKFKSGILSPVYIDNRRFPFFPHAWSLVIQGFETLINQQQLNFDILAGIETAGIPHSAALGYAMVKPSVFIRKQPKDHGTKKVVEGGDVAGKTVLLIEDHITTGGSSLAGVEGIRLEQGVVNDCLAITSYNFPEASENFSKSKVRLHTLTTFAEILDAALVQNLINPAQRDIVQDWLDNPNDWGSKYGHE